MVFSSPIFVFLFLPVIIAVYFLLRRRARNLFLLLASLFFYAWGEQIYFLVMLASIAVNWLLGLALDHAQAPRVRKILVTLAVILNVGALIHFKYTAFILGNLNVALTWLGRDTLAVSAPHLPLGISFFTFHALSYVIDIYRKVVRAQRHPIDFALYIAFFPQLIAGPIVRYHDIYRQLRERVCSAPLAVLGLERFIVGLAKKTLIANPLGSVTDTIFVTPINELTTPTAWLGIFCYSMQIYFDFSAYSDMAIGLARLFGFNFLENFNYPYRSASIQEFWRRWHISLSNWLRDYLYIPLGGNRHGEATTYRNLVIIFLVCGIWHGANWTFVIWGLIHGAFLVFERMGLGKILARLPQLCCQIYTMTVVVLAWVFFRAADLPQANDYFRHLFALAPSGHLQVAQVFDHFGWLAVAFAIPASLGLFTRLTSDWRCRAGQQGGELHPALETVELGHEQPWVLGLRALALIGLFVLAGSQLAASTYNPFIYFRF